MIKLDSCEIKWETTIKHLGNHIQYNLSEEADVAAKRRDFYGRVNVLRSLLSDAPEKVILRIFTSKCCHFYGVQAWRLSDKHVGQFYTAWNRAVRLILNLHPATHTRFLPVFAGWDIKIRITKSSLGLITNMKSHKDRFVHFIGNQGSHNMQSIIGENENSIPTKLHSQTLTDRDKADLSVVMELRRCVNGEMTINNFNFIEFKDIIMSICVY